MILATLGPAGTNSEAAAKAFAARISVEPSLVFAPVFQCLMLVNKEQADLAVLPAENMVDGLLGPTFDALIEFNQDLHVLDEVHLRVSHVLAAGSPIDPAAVVRVYSHASALNQCARNLFTLVPQAALVAVGSTAEAAARVAEDREPGAAAICSPAAVEMMKLAVVRQEMSDYPDNQTRFLVCGRGDTTPTGRDRTLIAVKYGPNQPGQLHRTTGAFAARGVDLTFVHSRPYKIRPQDYVILFEASGHTLEPAVGEALREVEIQAERGGGWCLTLGSFPRRDLG